jgi:hypothetical protein
MEIDRWHAERGFVRQGKHELQHIGYHRIITNGFLEGSAPHQYRNYENGRVYLGRDDNEIGAHVQGLNDSSLGICLVGKEGKFSPQQIMAMYMTLLSLMQHYDLGPEAVLGHCETKTGRAQGKTCPTLDMVTVRNKLRDLEGLAKKAMEV